MKKDQGFYEPRLVSSTWSRRAWLKIMLAAGAGTAFGGLPALAPAKTNTQLMRAIPASGEQIPAMGLGTSGSFEVGPSAADRAPVKEVLRLFIDNGGRLIDTSPMYGSAETVTGDLAAELGIQKDLLFATKVWTNKGRVAGENQMKTSMERLRTKRIDLMQVHNLMDWKTQLKTLRAWKKQGRIRYLGITHSRTSAYGQLADLIKHEDLDFVQFNYSIGTREAEKMLLPLTADKGTAVLINRAFEDGALFRRVSGRPPV